MRETVTGEEGNGDVVVGEDGNRGGGWSPWCAGGDGADGVVAGDGGEAGAAYEGDGDGFWWVLVLRI